MLEIKGESQGHSEVVEFYTGKSILVTGASGFVGKGIIEKLLRSCGSLKNIYVLIRPKFNLTIHQRLEELMKSSVFDRLRKENPNFEKKMVAICGDLNKGELGLSKGDREILKNEIQIVINSAANVKFNDSLRNQVELNLGGTQRLIDLAREMTNLVAFVHVSSAYANTDSDREIVDEVIYPRVPDLPQFIQDIRSKDHSQLIKQTPEILGTNPNTYTFTKALIENLLDDNKNVLPITIVRPSAVAGAVLEPVPGWVESKTASNGFILMTALGQLKYMKGDGSKNFDLIPIDRFVNLVIMSAWSSSFMKATNGIQILNSCPSNPISYKLFFELSTKHSIKTPFDGAISYPEVNFIRSNWIYLFHDRIFNFLPAYMKDLICRLLCLLKDKSKTNLAVYRKVDSVLQVFEHFVIREWMFVTENSKVLFAKLNSADRILFPFQTDDIDWPLYMKNYVAGVRKFVLKQDETSLESARKNLRRLYWRQKMMTPATIVILIGFSILIIYLILQSKIILFTELKLDSPMMKNASQDSDGIFSQLQINSRNN